MDEGHFRELWEIATPQERQVLARTHKALFDSLNWTPSERQATADSFIHTSEVDELLYGGAAGGGKSEWLIRHVIGQAMDHPGNRIAVFRRVWPSLARTIEPRMRILLNDKARYNSVKHEFTFPNNSIIELAGLQYKTDVHDYQGAEYGCIAFEEVTEFMQEQYEYMLSRLRAPALGIRPHVVATTNPGGIGHKWVKNRWVKNIDRGVHDGDRPPGPEIVWTPEPSITNPEPLSRVFVPATLHDNTALLERDPKYLTRLRTISNAGVRMALETGDWDAIEMVEGAMWEPDGINRTRIDIDQYPGGIEALKQEMAGIVVAVDPSVGGGDEVGIVVCGIDNQPIPHGYVLDDRTLTNPTPRQWGEAALAAFDDWDADAIVAEVNNGGDLVAANIQAIRQHVPYKPVRASRGKKVRAEPIAALWGDDRIPGRAHVVGWWELLERQMTTWTDQAGDGSPDRMDAMVWGLTHLMLDTAYGGAGSNIDELLGN